MLTTDSATLRGSSTSTGSGRPVAIAGRRVLDIRQDTESAAGHVPRAEHVDFGRLTLPSRGLAANRRRPTTGPTPLPTQAFRAAR